MCKWFCTSEGPSTNLQCLHCKTRYCGACLHGEAGKMENLVKCAKCGKKPRTLDAKDKAAGVKEPKTVGGYSPSAALKQSSSAKNSTSPDKKVASSSSSSSSSASASPKKKKSSNQPSIFDKLTDTKLYTGSHKLRFDEDGKGRGLAGRDAASGIEYGGSKVNDISQILRPNIRGTTNTAPIAATQVSTSTGREGSKSPTRSKSPVKKTETKESSSSDNKDDSSAGNGTSSNSNSNANSSSSSDAPKKIKSPTAGSGKKKSAGSPSKGGKSIFDKLTDTSLYTGSHKLRFDATGRGKGMAGRDAASGIEYGGGNVHSLSAIMRPNLK